MIGADHGRRLHEAHAVGDPIAYKEIGQGGDGEVAEDLRQGVDLVFLTHRPDFQKREAGVHGQDHDRTDQDKQGIGAVDQGVHRTLQIFHGGWQACVKGKKHQSGSSQGLRALNWHHRHRPSSEGVNRFSAAFNTTGRCRQGFSASLSYLG